MQPRLNYSKVAPDGVEGFSQLGKYIHSGELEDSLIELVKLRASQINGCAFCIDMHTKDARSHGESEQRLYGISAWHEAPFYTERERAALAWTEAVTLISHDHVPDELYDEVRQHFTEKELVDLTPRSSPSIAGTGWRSASAQYRELTSHTIRPR